MITSDSEYLKEMQEWFQKRVDIGEDTQLPADANMFSAKMYIANLEAENFEMNKYKKAIYNLAKIAFELEETDADNALFRQAFYRHLLSLDIVDYKDGSFVYREDKNAD